MLQSSVAIRSFAAATSVALLLLTWVAGAAADTSVAVRCVTCLPPGENRTVDLMLREDASTNVGVEWTITGEVPSDPAQIHLYAANPATQSTFVRQPAFAVSAIDGGYRGQFEFPANEIGEGTFVTILMREQGNRREILDWRAWRPLTAEEVLREKRGPARASNWELDVRPTALSVTSGRGALPYTRGGDLASWWSLADRQSSLTDLDIDGEHTGVPGLGVVWSAVWHARAPNLRDRLLQIATDVRGHKVAFENLAWIEEPDRSVEGYDEQADTLRHYYTVITLFTNASVQTFDSKDVRGRRFGNVTYFSHETSARLATPRDPRLWSSYNAREYGADLDFLGLLKDRIERGGNVPGLRQISMDDGDGGPIQYRIGFTADVLPWKRVPEGTFHAGFVALDVIATRRGVGGPVTEGYTGRSDIERAWCVVTGCGSERHSIDLNEPPDGYKVSSPAVQIASGEGTVPLLRNFDYARRGTGTNGPVERQFPAEAKFALATSMQAGALMKMKGWRGHIVDDVVPINVYAQYVVKMTVALTRERALVVAENPNIPADAAGLAATQIVVEKKEPTLLDRIQGFFRGLQLWILLLGVGVLALFVPGVATLLNAFLGLLSTVVGMIDMMIRKLFGVRQGG